MPPSHRVAVPILVLLLLLVATEMGTTKVTVAEDRDCVSQSQRFKGVCVSNNYCANTCNIEGFPEGECKYDGPNRKCYCKKKC